MPESMRVEKPPDWAKIEYLEHDYDIENNKSKSTSPCMFNSTPKIHITRPTNPAYRISYTDNYVHFHIIAIVESHRTEIMAMIGEIGETSSDES